MHFEIGCVVAHVVGLYVVDWTSVVNIRFFWYCINMLNGYVLISLIDLNSFFGEDGLAYAAN